ncbi:MAG: DUF6298 domain-containing protein [Planctomycetota bacterium]|jgi:hypothetical protein
MGKDTIRIHPDNSKIFEFRGKPLVLVCATEHYGSVMNRAFHFERYLAEARDKSQTLTRLFTLFREQQSHNNPYSPCKPESPDYISPFLRVGPELALDCQPKYDLDRWNPEFFERLHRFLSLAGKYGIIVEVVLFSNSYSEVNWALNPLNAANNINDVEEIKYSDYLSMRNAGLFELQCAYVRKMVNEINQYVNIIYEVCNEPGSDNEIDPAAATLKQVDDWQSAIAGLIRQQEAQLPNQHLIAGSQGWHMTGWECAQGQVEGCEFQPSDFTFGDFPVDIVNIHPLPNTTYKSKSYDLGAFMLKRLRLRPIRDYCLDTYHESKPLNMDEDNVASQYKDYDGWTIHRKRAWMTLLCGGHYDYIDFSIINYCETGTAESRRCIRSWMKYLSDFIHSVDLIKARPLVGWLKKQPKHTVEAVLAVPDRDYCIYIADGRELQEPGAGRDVQGDIVFDLPDGCYQMACFSPVTGLYSPWLSLAGSKTVNIQVPTFQHDIVIRIRKIMD